MASSLRRACVAVRIGAALAAAVLGTAMLPSAAQGAGFVPDVPDAPLHVECATFTALDDAVTVQPGGSVDLAQLAPTQLSVACSPSSASFGIDCGMPEMCGIDPCLCGSADEWGACSCNGLSEMAPAITCLSADPSVVEVEDREGRILLHSKGPGQAKIQVSARLPHHDEAVVDFLVNTTGPEPLGRKLMAGIVGGVLALGILACAAVLAVRKHRVRGAGAISVLMAAFVAAGLCGCAGAQVSAASPVLSDATFKASSSMTESSQRAEIRLTFDQPVSVSNSALDDFSLLLNGAPVDASTVSVEMRPDATGVTIILRPSAEAAGVGKGSYFALYQADVSLEPKREDGALPSITGADGSAAVLEEPVQGTFPSGAVIEEVEVIPGSSDAAQAAQTTFRVVSPATIRAVTWFSPDGGQTLLLKHNHTFADASVADCAEDLAKVVNASSGLGMSAVAQGDTVVLRAAEAVDGQELHPVIVEGVGVQGGAFTPLAE